MQTQCSSNMYSCPSHIMAFAYVSMIYLISCVFYLVVTRCIGTPFLDSLTEEQKQIKKKSSKQRANIFLYGIIIGIIVLHVVHPFIS